MKRVILDRSVFHGDRFTSLKGSLLSDAVINGTVSVLHTSTFIEETLMYALRHPDQFLEHWRYIVSLNDKQWFQTSDRILPIELGRKARRADYFFMKREAVGKVISEAARFARGNVPQDDMSAALSEVRRNYEIREDFRTNRLQLRKSNPQADYDFDAYIDANADWFIKDGVMKHHKNSRGYLKVWQLHRTELRFTEKYLRGWFSTLYLPVVDHNIKVDKNDRVDAEQLAFLEWADVFVSDDLRFVPRAFRLLYPAGDKILLTSAELIERLKEWAPAVTA